MSITGQFLQGNLEKSFSVESGDGWYVLYRAHLHLSNHGLGRYGLAFDLGDEKAQIELLVCRRIIRAEEDKRAATQGTASGGAAKA